MNASTPAPAPKNDQDTVPAARPRSPLDVLRDDVESRFPRNERSATGGAPQSRAAALGIIAPLPVPRVVITLAARTAQGVMDQVATIPQNIDPHLTGFPVQIELRLDTLQDNIQRAEAAAFILRIGVPFVLTMRAAREGGHATITETERQWLLAKLLAAMPRPAPPGSMLDIEAASIATDPVGWKGVLAAAQQKGLYLLLSHHDEAGTPRDPDALLPPPSLLDDAPGGIAAIYKSATVTRDWQEELTVLTAMVNGNAQERAQAIMGMGRPTSRLLAPFFRVPLVYATTANAPPAATGQVPFGDLLAAWWRWGVRPTDVALSDENNPQRINAESPVDPPPRLVLLGRPALHSLSPAIHNAAARHLELRHRYFPLEPPAHPSDPTALLTETLPWLPGLGVVGGNATTPFKEALAQTADTLDETAIHLGCANTFRYENARLTVTNTDPAGVRRSVEAAGIDIPSTRVLVLGAGAAARAAAYGLQGAERVTLTNRTAQRGEETQRLLDAAGVETHIAPWQDRAAAAKQAHLIVQCTTLGLAGLGHADLSPLPAAAMNKEMTVFESIYDPLETPLLAAARAAGARTIDGLQMLLAQGAEGFTYWTGKSAPLEVMQEAALQALRTALPASLRETPGRSGGKEAA